MNPRSYLFVPGNRPERFAKALASGADVVVLDLEDAVADEAKAQARDAIANWVAGALSAGGTASRCASTPRHRAASPTTCACCAAPAWPS